MERDIQSDSTCDGAQQAARPRRGTTKVLCVLPFTLPHMAPLYDALARRTDVEVVRACLEPIRKHRLALGWTEMPEDAPYIQPWRSLRAKWQYLKELLAADVIVMPGFSNNHTLPLHHWLRRLTGKPTLLWSEPFIGRRPRPWWKHVIEMLLKMPCNSRNMHLLSIGFKSNVDYYWFGARRWRSWLFCYAVEPAPQALEQAAAARTGPIRILFCGGLWEAKRLDMLLRCLSQPGLVELDWEFVLAGDGNLRDKLQGLSRVLGLEGRTRFLGAVPHQELGAVYQSCDFLVLPSRFEGWGAVVNEAMEYGLPIVCSDAVSASMLVEHGTNGFIFPSGDRGQLRCCLQRLITSRALIEKMGVAARRTIREYRPDRVAARLAQLCKGIAGKGPMPEFAEGVCSPLERSLKTMIRQRRQDKLIQSEDLELRGVALFDRNERV